MQKLKNPLKTYGKVIHGSHLGRTINYPTANIELIHPFTPKPGVYLAICKILKKNYLGLAYYGLQHLNQEAISNRLEIYLFNFSSNIYAQSIQIKLTHYLRPPKVIKKTAELKKLINQDLLSLDSHVVKVNKNDQIIGIEKILTTHLNPPQLHRAISVLIFNSKKELLLQKRSKKKPLWPLFWSNTCCTHPRANETSHKAATRRLKEEMGITSKLKPVFSFKYKARYNTQLSEFECDTVYLGFTNQKPKLNPKEAVDYQYISLSSLKKDLKLNSQIYTPWLKLIMKRLKTSDILTS